MCGLPFATLASFIPVADTLTHHNASAQALANERGGTTVVWISDLLPNDAAPAIASMMKQGAAIMKQTLDRIAELN